MLFNPNIDLQPDLKRLCGYVGCQFLSAGGPGEAVNYLGFYDAGGDGLANSHTLALWETGWNGQSSRGLLAEVTVAAGTSAPLVDGYRWVQLPSTISLVGNEYYLLNASVDGVDNWGDSIGGSQITWNSQYVPTDPGYNFSRQGVYGDSIPSYNGNGVILALTRPQIWDLMWFRFQNPPAWACWELGWLLFWGSCASKGVEIFGSKNQAATTVRLFCSTPIPVSWRASCGNCARAGHQESRLPLRAGCRKAFRDV